MLSHICYSVLIIVLTTAFATCFTEKLTISFGDMDAQAAFQKVWHTDSPQV